MIRLLLCDLDGTLVETWRTTPLPDARERLRVLQDQGVPVVVVTHQGGVGYRYAYEQRGEWAKAAQYPTFEDVQEARLAAIAERLPFRCPLVACTMATPIDRCQRTGDALNSMGPTRPVNDLEYRLPADTLAQPALTAVDRAC